MSSRAAPCVVTEFVLSMSSSVLTLKMDFLILTNEQSVRDPTKCTKIKRAIRSI